MKRLSTLSLLKRLARCIKKDEILKIECVKRNNKYFLEAREPLTQSKFLYRYLTDLSSNLTQFLKFFNPFLKRIIDMSEIDTQDKANKSKFSYDPPASVRGMTVFDKNAFKKTVCVPCVTVPAKRLREILRKASPYLFKMRKHKGIANLSVDDPAHDDYRLLLLDPKYCRTVDDIPDKLKRTLTECEVQLTSFRMSEVEIGYDNWSAQEILRAVIPGDIENVTGHTIMGTIAHVNLNSDTLPYKHVIGQVFLDKTSTIRTVINKLGTIENEYRVFDMEVIAGEENFITRTKENGFTYELDFSKVFWNSRLGTEHQRIVDEMKTEDVLYDVCAGIGPFSIPAAKKGVVVYANDLNPSSYECLQKNVRINKIKTENISCFNLDGREFIRTILKDDLTKRLMDGTKNLTSSENSKIHVVMNLPGIAVEFLDAFQGLLCDMDRDIVMNSKLNLPHVYCYCFLRDYDPEMEIQVRVKDAMGEELPADHKVRFVRNVAPKKDQYCIHFQLPPTVLLQERKEEYKQETTETEGCEPDEKKRKVETV